jgi:hypothetical protein
MTTDKRGVSALLVQRQLGLSCYETAWMTLHKLRRAMVNATRDPLHGEVEVEYPVRPDHLPGGARVSHTRRSKAMCSGVCTGLIVTVEGEGWRVS